MNSEHQAVGALGWESGSRDWQPFYIPASLFRKPLSNNLTLTLPDLGKNEVSNFLYLNILLLCIILSCKRKTEKAKVTGGKRQRIWEDKLKKIGSWAGFVPGGARLWPHAFALRWPAPVLAHGRELRMQGMAYPEGGLG